MPVCHTIVFVQLASLYHVYLNVCEHGFVAFAVNTTLFVSLFELLTLLSVIPGSVHVAVLPTQVLAADCASRTFAYAVYVHGGVNVLVYVLVVVDNEVLHHASLYHP